MAEANSLCYIALKRFCIDNWYMFAIYKTHFNIGDVFPFTYSFDILKLFLLIIADSLSYILLLQAPIPVGKLILGVVKVIYQGCLLTLLAYKL